MTAELVRHLFTVSDFDRMVEAGVFRDEDRVELIQGEIIEMPPIGIDHSSVVAKLIVVFAAAIASQQVVPWVQSSFHLSDRSEPEPDFMLLKWRDDVYKGHFPTPADILLLVEVADSSLDHDRRVKLPLYAQASIHEVWIADIKAEAIEVCRHPTSTGYQSRIVAGKSEQVAAELFPQTEVAVSRIFG